MIDASPVPLKIHIRHFGVFPHHDFHPRHREGIALPSGPVAA
jgi:hypothetical protein